MRNFSGKRSGFTILELLAVVAVIALLTALLFPFVGSTIDRAHGAKCAANLKALGAASLAYAADNDGFLPVTYSIDSVKGGSFQDGGAWYWLVAPYVDVPRWDTLTNYLGPQGGKIGRPCVFTCPSHGKDEPGRITFPSNKPVSYAPPGPISTLMQTKVPTSVTDTGNVWGLRSMDVNQPSRKVWLADSVFPTSNSIGGNRLTDPGPNGWGRIAFSRHDGSGNAVFYDGHVERISYASLIAGDKDRNVKNLFDPSAEIVE